MSRDPRFPMSTPSGLIRLSPHCQGPRAITSFSLRLPFLKKTQSPLQAGGQHPGTWKQVSCFWRPRNTRQQSLYNEVINIYRELIMDASQHEQDQQDHFCCEK
ncbi:uncharacterized protein LOC144090479 isoform X9 [Stigmatopora argus]